jgi:hypothetical protein
LPIIVPPFVQYQAPLFPLRGLWNAVPKEGDRFVSAEIDWGQTVPLGQAVQFQLSGNSPLAFSQIVAFSVDNTRNASDATFLFPDSGYTLVVPAYTQGTFPVFTNALMFYVASIGAVTGDRTVFQALNSMPPPVAVQESAIQENNALTGVNLTATATVPLVPAGINGTLEYISATIAGLSATGSATISLDDGNTPAKNLWLTAVIGSTAAAESVINVGPIRVGFVNGINLKIVAGGTPLTSGTLFVNVYYGVP